MTSIDGKKTEKVFPPGDQFASELIYFSDCVIRDQAPEPSGKEGLADARVINAIYESAKIGRAVRIKPVPGENRDDGHGRNLESGQVLDSVGHVCVL